MNVAAFSNSHRDPLPIAAISSNLSSLFSMLANRLSCSSVRVSSLASRSASLTSCPHDFAFAAKIYEATSAIFIVNQCGKCLAFLGQINRD